MKVTDGNMLKQGIIWLSIPCGFDQRKSGRVNAISLKGELWVDT